MSIYPIDIQRLVGTNLKGTASIFVSNVEAANSLMLLKSNY